MAVAALKPALTLKTRFASIAGGFKKATTDVGRSTKILLKKTKVKGESIRLNSNLFKKREEGIRRNEKESELEASKVGSGIKAVGKPIIDTGKDLLGRIMDAVGSFILGWLVYNLPTIMSMARNLISRLQRAGQIISGFFGNVVKIFTGTIKVAGALLTNLVTLDIFDTNKRVQNSFSDLYNTFGNMKSQIEEGMGLVTKPLGELPGEEFVSPTGTSYTTPAGGGPGVSGYGTPEQQALLKSLRFAEGTSKSYGTIFGGNVVKELEQGQLTVQETINLADTGRLPKRLGGGIAPGYGKGSKATGAYQFMPDTLEGLIRLGVLKPNEPFTPETQDRAALALAARRGVTADVLKKEGLSANVAQKLAPEWASVPTKSGRSYYGQPVKSLASLQKVYKEGLASPQPMGSVPTGASSNALANAAATMKGFSTVQGPNRGRLACVWAVNQVFKKAGMTPPWGTSDYVPTAEQSMIRAGYRQIPIGQQRPGDLYICHDQQHIGIVLPNGNIISNSTSGAKFSWEAPLSSYQSYYRGPGKFYRMPGADIAALPGKPGAQIPAQSAALISSPQQAQISSINPAKQSQQLQGSRQGQQVVVVDDRPQQVQVPNIPSSNNGGGQMVMLSPSKETVLNNLIKNHILLDLAYT
jgi:muramidase (phage lysozyme)